MRLYFVLFDELAVVFNTFLAGLIRALPFRMVLADKVYQDLEDKGIEVLYDDRQAPAGEKFSDADLIGIPVRLLVSEKLQENLEWKKRNEEKSEILSFEEALKRLKKD